MTPNRKGRFNSSILRRCLSVGAVTLIGGILFMTAGFAPALAGSEAAHASSAQPEQLQLPLSADGWIDLQTFLVASDGTHKLGNYRARFNDTRDRGSKIVFFDPIRGDNQTADVYWWDGWKMVDSAGRAANPANGKAYGTNPLEPDEDAIQPFRHATGMVRNADADPRLRTHDRDCEAVAGGYPDWILLRRGRTHDTFDSSIVGGRSEREPMVLAAYGPRADGRAIIAPVIGKRVRFRESERRVCNPLSVRTQGMPKLWLHMVLSGLDFRVPWSAFGAHTAESHSGGPVTAYVEDCRWAFGEGSRLIYLPRKTTIRRSVVAFSWKAEAHNQGFFTSGFGNSNTFEEVIFYRNGYKTNPRVDPDPRRDIFSRNIYQGGGLMMGHRYLGIISADGGSGGPQMRLGGRIEASLVVEGYWFSSTNSNKTVNPWLVGSAQVGQSAIVRNNVQLVYAYPTPEDPDTDKRSSKAAQPAWGYALASSSFGALVEGNIVSQAMLIDELGATEGARGYGFELNTKPQIYEDGKSYVQQNNTLCGNIAYRTSVGLRISGDWTDAKGIVVEDNVFVAKTGLQTAASTTGAGKRFRLHGNRFYSESGLPPAVEVGNTLAPYAGAAATEHWPDPNRALKRYVKEVLGLTLLDWSDDPFLDPVARDARARAGESYDPTGLKTFMAVATNMRRGGTQPVPAAAKPSWTGDYPWDGRFTGRAVVNWIRAGFGKPPVNCDLASRPKELQRRARLHK